MFCNSYSSLIFIRVKDVYLLTKISVNNFRGNFVGALDHFNQAIERYTSKEELKHLFTVRNTCAAQIKALKRLGQPLYPDSFMPGFPG